MNELIDGLYESLKLPLSYFISPGKRIHIFYLFTSLALAFYVYSKSKPNISFLKYVLPKKVWLSKSAQVDYSLFFINALMKVFIISPILVLGVYLQEWVSLFLSFSFGDYQIEVSRSTVVILYTITLWLFDDFCSFLIHLLMHKIPFLWRFHKIHHSATVLNPITQYRIHPGELLLNSLKEIFVFGLVTGVFYFVASGKIGIMAFLGVNIFRFFFLALGSNLRHSHVKLTFPKWMELFILSPFQHQIHHSDNPQHYDKNIGSHLAVWDWIFGTLLFSKQVNKIRFGLGNKENEQHKTLVDNIISPIRSKDKK